MEEIRIYHSIWKNAIVIAVCFAFAAMGVNLLSLHRGSALLLWICIIFFGGGGLFMLFMILRERLRHIPYYVITDDTVYVNTGGRNWEVHFADVESFFLTSAANSKMVGIRYKDNIESQKMNDAGEADRAVRRLNIKVSGSQEALPAEDLTVKARQLLEILDERLKDYKEKHKK